MTHRGPDPHGQAGTGRSRERRARLFDTVFGLPPWRARFGVPVLPLTVAAVASVPVAVQSGSAFVAAGVATYEVVRVGHAGSTAVWRDLVRNTGP